jgi:hypothetical protein
VIAIGARDGITYDEYAQGMRAHGVEVTPTNLLEDSRLLGSSAQDSSGEVPSRILGEVSERDTVVAQGPFVRIGSDSRERSTEDCEFADFLRSTPF